jgi:regulator of protease activity HflC (stomatin/prohibitin superfamily)
MDDQNVRISKWICFILFVIFMTIFGYYNFLAPRVRVWQDSMAGQAELAHAEYSRRIATCEALAKKESAKALADAEVIRAEGVAKANKIIGDSLTQNEAYLRYLWIQGLQTNNMSVVYIPTEANLPILEAQRWTEEQRIHRR